MPLLQSYLAGRGFGDLGAGTLTTSHMSNADGFEFFVCGCAACASKAYAADGDNGGFSALSGNGVNFRQTWGEDIFRIGEDGPQFQGSGTTDTVPGSPNILFSISIGGSVQGRVNTPGDDDYYAVTLVAGQSYEFVLVGSGGTPLLDPFLELRDENGGLVARNDDSGPGYGSLIRWTATESGTFYLNARAYEDPGNPTLTGNYTLTANIGTPQDPLDTIDYNYTVPTSTIEVYFATTGQTFNGATSVRNWTTTEINAVFAALATYSNFTPLTFVQTNTQANAEFTLVLANLDPGTLGWFAPSIGVGAFSPSTSSWQTSGSLLQGGSAFATLIHEFGHALGMAHPHDEGGITNGAGDGGSEIMQGVVNNFSSYGSFLMNQGVFTTMSYNDGWELAPWGPNFSLATGSQGTPMALDIALMQQRYGTNATYNNTNTTYTLTGANGAWTAIWDTGGTDTIAYVGAGAANIDLRAATLLNEVGGGGFVSYVTNFYQGFTIANGVVIENASGSAGADTLIGNAIANRLTGAGNNDTIDGGRGIDTAVYTVSSTTSTWVRNEAGTWTVTTGAVNGTDAVSNVEFLEFTDRSVHLAIAADNFFGDGTSDILLRRNDGVTAIWDMSGASVAQSNVTQWQAPSDWDIQGLGDFNGDGRDDFLLRRQSDGVTSIWTMNGFAVQAADVTQWQAGQEWHIQDIGDFNGDGVDDFLWRRTDGVTAIWQMNGTTVVQANVTNWQAGLEWTLQGVGDFNGDGRDDFLWRRASDGVTSIWQMNGANVTSADVTGQTAGSEWDFVGVGDFNGDGRDDLLLQRDDGVTAIWLMNGTTVLSAALTSQQAGSGWSFLNVGDYSGDGRDDLLLRRDSDGATVIWTMNGASVVSANVTSQQVGLDWGII